MSLLDFIRWRVGVRELDRRGVDRNSYSHTSKFFRLDGLLLFCMIMGLCSASSTIIYKKVSLVLTQVHGHA